MPLLDPSEIAAQLEPLSGWIFTENALRRDFRFRNFHQAFAFMEKVAGLAEAQNHHPDWHNCYNRVSIALWTHSAGGVTDKDFALAKAIQSIDSSSPMPPANTAARPPSQQLG